jgi:hypothetical protein
MPMGGIPLPPSWLLAHKQEAVRETRPCIYERGDVFSSNRLQRTHEKIQTGSQG